jgi:hypothetical protein
MASVLATVKSLCAWMLLLIAVTVVRLLWVLVRPFVVKG